MRLFVVSLTFVCTLTAAAQNWATVSFITHSTYQAVNANGASAYTGGFPFRMVGVALNNHEDWLDPTANYNAIPFNLGGQWEVFMQSIDPADRAGTAVYMGQNYGNLPFIADPDFSYSNDAWNAEMARVNYPEGPAAPPVRAGDLLEIRSRAGLEFRGKMNVNEQHSLAANKDWELVILERDYGLPTPEPIALAAVKDPNNLAIFDPTRQTGGERYQSRRVTLRGVHLVSPAGWGPNTSPRLVLSDRNGRTLEMHLGRNPSFAASSPPVGAFSVTGFLNQESLTGRDGYYLMVMNAADVFCGDANCDGVVDFADIDAFILALSSIDDYSAAYPGCDSDLSGDGAITFEDIDPFVAALSTTGSCD